MPLDPEKVKRFQKSGGFMSPEEAKPETQQAPPPDSAPSDDEKNSRWAKLLAGMRGN